LDSKKFAEDKVD
jgi:hypothetical protein